MTEFDHTAVLGAGVIGASWAALFLASGRSVAVYDNADYMEESVRKYIDSVWPTLEELGLVKTGLVNTNAADSLVFHSSAVDAVAGADFIQECVPERLAVKHALFSAIEPGLAEEAIVASSASGLTLSEMQSGWRNPSRFILGHPFNPPHLIPLVELLANDKTDVSVLPRAESFYQQLGKATIRVRREVPAHVANRLQAALWREAISLVAEGVASVEDVDKAVWAGPGLRWAAMGPHQLFHLGAGAGGLREFCARYGDSFHRWWDDLGDVKLNSETVDLLLNGVQEKNAANNTLKNDAQNIADESTRRDELIVALLRASRELRD